VIVSHQHRFVFVKTFKTAGTSVEIGLSAHCGPDDVITPIMDEDLRRASGGRGPQHDRVPVHRYRAPEIAAALRRRDWVRFAEHTPAVTARRLLGRRVWNDYFTFTIERNPWDKVISAYYWRFRAVQPPWPSIAEWLQTSRSHVMGFELYADDGSVIVDRVLRYESLDDEIAEVAALLGLAGPVVLPRAKTGHRLDQRPYREVLGPAERERIAHEYAREIAFVGYEF